MEVLKEDFSNLEIGTSVESFQKFLESQGDLFRSQVDQLQRIVVTQCKLTGVNPLSQEMAAGALSIKIGKRPRDLLNPKAIKYMQTVFSIKDALGKKESREISALFGVKVSQVRDFFNNQRSRVRKLVRLSREKSVRSNSCKQLQVGDVATNSDPGIPINPVPLNSFAPVPINSDGPVPLNSDAPVPLNSDAPVPLNSDAPVPLNSDAPVPLNSIEPSKVDNGPSCLTDDSNLSGIDGIDKQFVQNIFSWMRKEDTFAGQVKLMESILQIQNSSVLCWFLTKGGAIILATWLCQAAAEEQTSFLHVILEVLCHLPLHKALPVHISAILQSVNKLRFYRTSDISNRARFLLSRWSKLLTRAQTLKKPNGMKPFTNSQTNIILQQSIDEIMYDESWQSNIELSENVITPHLNPENKRKLESHQTLKLLPASSDDLNRKNIHGLSSSKTRVRRKVQMVEQPGQKLAGRNLQGPRASLVSQGRPMSTDDIQKAKMRAQFLQSKHGKTGSSNGSMDIKSEVIKKSIPLASSASSPASRISLHPRIDGPKKAAAISSRISNRVEIPVDQKIEIEFKESLGEKCKRVQIQWRTPPEIKLNDLWRVGAGENSKEVQVQKSRNSREKEIFYHTILEIPPDPKEPWDLEMDYDDTLTPEILTEQLPDNETLEAEVRNPVVDGAVPLESPPSQDHSSTAEPDLELLAVLLKNPELVFALTSGQAGNLPSEETVKLLDMIKAGGAEVVEGVNNLCKTVEKVEVSLPSPTPSSDVGTSGWKPAAAKNPFSHRESIPSAATSRIAGPRVQVNHHITTPNPQLAALLPVSRQFPATVSQFTPPQNTLNGLQPLRIAHSHHQGLVNSSSEALLAMSILPTITNSNQSAVAASSLRIEGGNLVKPVSFTSNTSEGASISFQSPPSPTPAPMHYRHPQSQQYRSEHLHQTRVNMSLPPAEKSAASLGWRPRQESVSHYSSRANQNNESSLVGGSMQQQWGRNEYVGGGGEFESWSPENSPARIEKYSEPRMNSGRSHGPDHQRQRSPYGYREQNRHASRRWRDRQY